LFSSAAEACESSLIAILLSGYGQDGVNGMAIVREKGGWAICQLPDDCAFNFNVVAALEEGVVDEVGSRDEIAQKVYARRSASIV
jgi:two-component system chemotaxis response regulator CheB